MTGAKTKHPLSRWERAREREKKGTESQARARLLRKWASEAEQ